MVYAIPIDEVGVSNRRPHKEKVCKFEGCKKILNSYNKTPYCFIHKRERFITKFDREIQKEFDKKRHKWFQLSNWTKQSTKLNNIGLDFKHRKVREKKHHDGNYYAVFVKD